MNVGRPSVRSVMCRWQASFITFAPSVVRFFWNLRAKIAVGLFLFLCLIILPRVSQGHAFPDHSEPRVGATVSDSPNSVRIWFDGDLEPVFSTIVVQDVRGTRVDKGNGRVNPSNAMLLEVSIPPLPAGTYRVVWNVVARDGHRTMGNYTFTIK